MTRSIALIAACVVLMSAANVFAAIITQPTSLNLGDKYRLAFVTSGMRNATSTNIADYNTFVTNAANAVPALASLGTTWKAIGSTLAVDARNNTNTVPSTVTGGSLGVPIFLLNDTKLVDSNDDLWDGSIDLPLNRTELDTAVAFGVWTGTLSIGVKSGGSELGNSSGWIPSVESGLSSFPDSRWISRGAVAFTSVPNPFYAISGELTAIPEPGTFTLLLTALGAVGVMYPARKQKAALRNRTT